MPPPRMSRIGTCSESGATFVEAVVALAILAAIAATFLSGLALTSRAARLADEQITAESLAQSQMAWVQNAAYVSSPAQYSPAPLPSGIDGMDYSVTIDAVPLHGIEDGIQKITIAVKRSGKGIIKLESYKVNR